jgi:uncharacterized membrane protein YeaQ/YmgE (transglycosylase-associated protein family)
LLYLSAIAVYFSRGTYPLRRLDKLNSSVKTKVFLEHKTMTIIAWLILGLLAGAIAKAIYPGAQGGGILATMLLGIVGAFIGGSLYTLLTTGGLQLASVGFTLPGLLIAVLGAIVAIFLWGLMTRNAV